MFVPEASASLILQGRGNNTTIRIYGSRFNESSGVCAMESWLEEGGEVEVACQAI